MVHDPRVSQTLARLGGVYRDPARIDRDAGSLLKSSVGNLLRPIAAELFEDNGQTTTVLVLQGTIAMYFRGNTYQLLVDVYLPAAYPNRPPVCFVRLADNMYLKENHRHVGSDGKVYLPYLHEWRNHDHNLVELVVAMSSVFSADPPVFSRAATATQTATSTMSTAATATSVGNTAVTSAAAAASPGRASFPSATSSVTSSSSTNNNNNNWQQQQAEAALAAEAAEANAAAAGARHAAQDERAKAAQRQWEDKRTQQQREAVSQKIQVYLQKVTGQVQTGLQSDGKDAARLTVAKEQKIEAQLELYRTKVKDLERQCVVAKECKVDLEAWLEAAAETTTAAAAAAANGTKAPTKTSMDEVVQPANKLHAQMLDLCTENAAISDALYFLDRALYQGNLDLDTHLRQIRQLAKRQFLVRAHLVKINQLVMDHPPPKYSC
jgi:ESCRT-I complex subunit TSG101